MKLSPTAVLFIINPTWIGLLSNTDQAKSHFAREDYHMGITQKYDSASRVKPLLLLTADAPVSDANARVM
jgi:hypothetical protein